MEKDKIKREWFLIDAGSETLGRLAVRISRILQGKHKPCYASNQDTGDFVVVINAKKIKVTGRKSEDKVYFHHSGYPGGLKKVPFEKIIKSFPEKIIEHAVMGMLPKNKLRKPRFKRLKIYRGSDHGHLAQKPKLLE